MSRTRKESPLSTYKRLSPNCTKPRNAVIKRITPHCLAGNLTVEAALGLSMFITPDSEKGASCNYAIDTAGRIGLGVEEINRSWCTSSKDNDHQAITVEISNNGGAPDWSMSAAAIESWINLAVNIAKYYGYKRVMYKEKPATMAIGNAVTEAWLKTWNAPDDAMLVTLHCWYKNKSCPGPFFIRQLPAIVDEINKRLGNPTVPPEPTPAPVPQSAPEVESGRPLLKKGAKGNAVKEAQSKLNFHGANLIVDGDFGSLTEEAVKRVQTLNGLTVDGIIGPNTWRVLYTPPVIEPSIPSAPQTPDNDLYQIRITATALNVRSEPTTNSSIVKTLVNDKNVYTVVEERNGWGKLKSGIGWISLEYTKRV